MLSQQIMEMYQVYCRIWKKISRLELHIFDLSFAKERFRGVYQKAAISPESSTGTTDSPH